jgi:hypothetical protein
MLLIRCVCLFHDVILFGLVYCSCDNSDGPHCWLTGIAFSFWEQYVTIDTWLVSVALLAVAVGVVASALFFYMGFRGTGVTLSGGPHNNSGDSHKINHGSSSSTNQDSPSAQTGIDQGAARAAAMGGLVVGSVSLLSQFTVIGLSCFVGVSLNGLSAMACLMSTGFSVEYAVHVVHRFMMVRVQIGQSLSSTNWPSRLPAFSHACLMLYYCYS